MPANQSQNAPARSNPQQVEAFDVLRDALAVMPAADQGVRSDFFAQWRARVMDAIEHAWPDDPDAAREFRDIEFGPRRLSGDHSADEAHVRETFHNGCAAARAL